MITLLHLSKSHLRNYIAYRWLVDLLFSWKVFTYCPTLVGTHLPVNKESFYLDDEIQMLLDLLE